MWRSEDGLQKSLFFSAWALVISLRSFGLAANTSTRQTIYQPWFSPTSTKQWIFFMTLSYAHVSLYFAHNFSLLPCAPSSPNNNLLPVFRFHIYSYHIIILYDIILYCISFNSDYFGHSVLSLVTKMIPNKYNLFLLSSEPNWTNQKYRGPALEMSFHQSFGPHASSLLR